MFVVGMLYALPMAETPDPTKLATSFVHLIQRFTGNQPDALAQMRRQIETERDTGRQMMERAEAQLVALDQLEQLVNEAESNGSVVPAVPAPPLKDAIRRVLNENPKAAWSREALYGEIMRRGWGPGGANPRNTFTGRLRDLELASIVRRLDNDTFVTNEMEVSA